METKMYNAKKVRSDKSVLRTKMVRALIDAEYTCSEVAEAFDMTESHVRACLAGTNDEN